MRVAILTYTAHTGAFATVARNIAKGLAAQSVGVDLLYLVNSRGDEIEAYPGTTRFLRIGGRSRTCWIGVLRYLRRTRPDVLISLGWVLNPAAVVGVALARTRTVLLLNEASLLSYKSRVEHRASWALRSLAPLARLLYPRAHAVTGVSSAVVEDLVEEIGLNPRRVALHVVPNAVDADQVVAASRRTEPLIAGPEPLFVNVARHARQKNLPLLLRGFARFHTETGTGTLVLIGDGPESEHLHRLAAELGVARHVYFLGCLDNPFPQMAAATALVLTSEEEGFGLVLIEAMALGVPVIATDCPGAPRELLRGGLTGLLVPNQDENALTDALQRIATDSPLRARLSEVGRKRARDFSPETVGQMWLELSRSSASPGSCVAMYGGEP